MEMITASKIIEIKPCNVLLTIDDRLSWFNGNYILEVRVMGYYLVDRIKGDYFLVRKAFDAFGDDDAKKLYERTHKRKYYNG